MKLYVMHAVIRYVLLERFVNDEQGWTIKLVY